MNNMRKKVAIIGGGASGVMCAILIKKECDVDLCIYEKQSRILKKLLQTGNGMCNITNANCDDIKNYNTDKIKHALDMFNHNKELDTFNSLGLLIKEESEGRCYPYSKKANTVYEIFEREINNLGIKVKCDTEIKDIKYDNTYKLVTNNGTFDADYIVIASGSKSGVVSEYNVYNMLSKLGYNIINLRPSLVGFKVKENIKALSGIRFKSKVSLFESNKLIESRSGEVQFKDDGVSGIVIMELSRLYNSNKDSYLSIDLMNDYSEAELTRIIENNVSKYHSLEDCVMGMLPKMLVLDITKKASDINSIVKLIKNYKLNIKDTYDFSQSQVTRGGVDLDDVKLESFESKKHSNLYMIGEVLDVDGNCGGYNLHFAFASANLASQDIIKKIRG